MKPRNAYCSFCRRSHTDVGPLVEGPGEVYICGECIELCQSIIDQERRRRSPPRPSGESGILRAKLDQLVRGQDEAKQALALAAESRSEGGGRVLLIGPSSSAKILLARALAHALEAPFAAGDARDLARSQVCSVEGTPLLFRLLQASEFDVEAAQRGVVFAQGAERPDAQDALLHLWRHKACEPVAGFQLAVGGILFVCGCYFAGFDEAIAHSGRHLEQPVNVEDLKAVGVRLDWAGYLAGIARVEPLDEESLVRIVQWVDFHCGNGR
jgi:ATP-dependent Clp protease ATP-binding subunit ClpX